MELLTDGSANSPILEFCQSVISRHVGNWPPTENILAEEFVGWLGAQSLMTPSVMQELCLSRGINLSFVPLPPELHGLNCSFQNKNEIVISEQTRGSAHTEIVYGPYGLKLALMNGQTLVNAFVKLPGGSRAVYNGSGLAYYRHGDHLGSSRLATTPSRTKYYDVAYAPYGENYDGSGTTPDLAFTDQNQDTVGGGSSFNLYDFMFREYRAAHGRWTQPDPAGLGAVDPTNPQSWNRYAYVLNNPMAMIDLLGDDGCYDSQGNNLGVDQMNCYSYGGVYLDNGQWVGSDGNVYGPPQYVNGSTYTSGDGVTIGITTGGWMTPNLGSFFNMYGFNMMLTSFQTPAPSPGCPPGANCTGQGGSPTNNVCAGPSSPIPCAANNGPQQPQKPPQQPQQTTKQKVCGWWWGANLGWGGINAGTRIFILFSGPVAPEVATFNLASSLTNFASGAAYNIVCP